MRLGQRPRRTAYGSAAAQINPATRHRWAEPADMAVDVSDGRWIRAAHLDLLSRELAKVARTPGDRVIVTMPPQHGKTELTSRWNAAWALVRDPATRLLVASYGAAYATRHGRWVRNLLRANPDLGVAIADDSARMDEWETSLGGGMVSAGVGEGITGRGFDLVLIDDPVKGRNDVESTAYRRHQWDWYTDDLSTRLRPGASIILVMTRWHRDDLGGRLKAEAEAGGERWREVHLQALVEPRTADPLGRKTGEALWPDRYPAAVLEATRRRLGPYGWSSLYQGNPRPRGGGAFWNDEDLRVARAAAPRTGAGELAADLVRVVVAVDPAASAEPGSDETGIIVAGRGRDGRAGILHDRSGIMSTDQWGRAVVQAFLDTKADAILYEANMGGNMVASVITSAARAMGVRIPRPHAVHARRGKALRAEPVHQLYREGLVWHAAGFPDLSEQMTEWHPDTKDSPDRLDAAVYALTELLLGAGRTLVES